MTKYGDCKCKIICGCETSWADDHFNAWMEDEGKFIDIVDIQCFSTEHWNHIMFVFYTEKNN